MFRIGSKAKIIIIVDCYTIYCGRSGVLIDLTVKLKQLFGEQFQEIINSCLLVVTKIDLNKMSLPNIRGKL